MNRASTLRENREREIDLVSLLRAVFKKWRLLLILAVCFAVLAALYNYRSQKKAIAAAKEAAAAAAAEAVQEERTGTMADGALTELGDISSLKEKILRTIDKKLTYLDQTELSVLDPLAEARAHFDIAVTFEGFREQDFIHEVTVSVPEDAEDPETLAKEAISVTDVNAYDAAKRKSQDLLNFYIDRVNYVITADEAAEKIGGDPAFIRELMYGGVDVSGLFAYVNVGGTTEERADILCDDIIAELREAKDEAVSLYGEHELLIFNRSTMMILNQSRTTWLNDRMSEINSLMNNYNNLTANEQKIRDAGEQLISEKTVESGPAAVSRRALVKFACIGFAGGAVLAAVLLAIVLVLRQLVLSGRDLNTQLRLRKIAALPPADYDKLRGPDKGLASADLRYASNPDPGKCYAMAVENIRVLLEDGKDIALIGDLPAADMEAVADALQKADGAISYHMLSDLSEPAMLKELDSCNAAVLVAGTMRSVYSRISDLLLALDERGKEVLGSIVLTK